MNITKHAQTRSRQREIPSSEIELILKYGKTKLKPGGAEEIGIPNKYTNTIIIELRRLINKFEKIRDKKVLVKNGTIITVYHTTH